MWKRPESTPAGSWSEAPARLYWESTGDFQGFPRARGWASDLEAEAGQGRYSQSGSPAPGRIAAPSPSASAQGGAAGRDPGLRPDYGGKTRGGTGDGEEIRWRRRWQLWPPGRGPRSSLGPARTAAERGARTRCHDSLEGRGRKSYAEAGQTRAIGRGRCPDCGGRDFCGWGGAALL